MLEDAADVEIDVDDVNEVIEVDVDGGRIGGADNDVAEDDGADEALEAMASDVRFT